jgi:hypothetical protein
MILRLSRALAALAALTFVIACRGEDALVNSPLRVEDEAPAASAGASTPYLTAASDGTVWMSWMERGADSAWVLRAAHRPVNGRWSEPVVVVRDSLIFANWADFPSIAVDDNGRLVSHFLRRSAPGKYSYHVWVTTSADSGATWSTPQRLHSDTSASEHGFAALVPQPDGSTFAAWLDGRATGGETGAMSLGFGVVDSTLHVRPDTMLDTRVCDCCQVAGTRTGGGGALFAYRDRSEDEVRDIAVVRFDEGRWWPPAIVIADGWVTRACPVNGPALSSRNHGVALAWFTNARDTAKVQLAFSTDRGATWSAAVRVDDGAPLGRVDVEYLADGGALVTWMEQSGKGVAEIRAKRVRSDGVLSAATVVSATSDARAAGFPRIAAASDTAVYVAWREMTTPARLRLTMLTVPDTR